MDATSAAPPVVVAGFGASTMRGWRPGLGARETFRALLEADLAVRGLNVIVGDAAQPGNTVLGGLQRFERDVLAPAPAAVLLLFGLNDSSPRSGDPARNRVSPATFREVHGYFLDTLERRNIPCAVLTCQKPPPPDATEREARLAPYVDIVRALAAERSVPLIDLHAKLAEAAAAGTDLRELYLDGLHFNARGHRFAADVILGFEEETSFFANLSHPPMDQHPSGQRPADPKAILTR